MNFATTNPTRAATAALLAAGVLAGQSRVAVEIPDGVPLEIVSSEFGNSEFEPRGGVLVIRIDGTVRFRHTGSAAVRAVTLAVSAHERSPGGRAAVAVPSLHARSGEEFSIHLNLRMLRPLPLPAGPAVRIAPDGVLFDTLESAGPNRLDSVRKMKVRELEARRDRQHFLARWQAGGRNALASAMQASLRRQAARPRLDIRLAGEGPATAGSDVREIQFALVQDAAAPLVLEGGRASVTGVVSDTPRIRLRNRVDQPVRHFEIGWLVQDSDGAVYSAGVAPVEASGRLDPGEPVETGGSRRFALRPASRDSSARLETMAAYIRSAQLENGTVWIPSRQSLEASQLLRAVPVSDEERRLTQMYRQRGPDAVAAELQKLAGNRR